MTRNIEIRFSHPSQFAGGAYQADYLSGPKSSRGKAPVVPIDNVESFRSELSKAL